MKGEIWKDIEGYEGLYQVSNMGRVKSLNYRRTGKERIMKPYDNGKGYLKVQLYKDGNGKQPLVHVLVATAFLDNVDNLPEVNHKDEDKTNNCVENLEWCSAKHNCNYGSRNKRVAEKLKGKKKSEEHIKKVAEKHRKPVYSIDKESGLITYWESATVASRQTGIASSNICHCLKGRQKSVGGHYWLYADDNE